MHEKSIPAILRRRVKTVPLLVLLAVLAVVLAGFGGRPQQPLPPLEPETVGCGPARKARSQARSS